MVGWWVHFISDVFRIHVIMYAMDQSKGSDDTIVCRGNHAMNHSKGCDDTIVCRGNHPMDQSKGCDDTNCV